MNPAQKTLKQTKKSRLLQRKKILKKPQVSKYSYLFKHQNKSGSCPVDPFELDSPRKLFIQDMFCFKKIQQIVRNDKFLCLKLKETNREKGSLQEHLVRFKNSKSEIFQNFGKILQLYDEVRKHKFQTSSRTQLHEVQNACRRQLQQTLSTFKDKKYVCFFYGPTADMLSFSQIILSTPLLTTLGHDPQQFCDDFLKYKHLFFQILDITLFDRVIDMLGESYKGFLQMCAQRQKFMFLGKEELSDLKLDLELTFDNFIYRTIKKNDVLLQQKLNAKFKYARLNQNTTILELTQIDESTILSCEEKKISALKQGLINEEQARVEKELEFMRKLMHSTSISPRSGKSPMLIDAAN